MYKKKQFVICNDVYALIKYMYTGLEREEYNSIFHSCYTTVQFHRCIFNIIHVFFSFINISNQLEAFIER